MMTSGGVLSFWIRSFFCMRSEATSNFVVTTGGAAGPRTNAAQTTRPSTTKVTPKPATSLKRRDMTPPPGCATLHGSAPSPVLYAFLGAALLAWLVLLARRGRALPLLVFVAAFP